MGKKYILKVFFERPFIYISCLIIQYLLKHDPLLIRAAKTYFSFLSTYMPFLMN